MFLLFFAVPFLGIGFYAVIGRFIYQYWTNTRTIYAVTDLSVVVLFQTFLGRRFRTISIASLQEAERSIGRDGSGTISFGSQTGSAELLSKSGLGFLQSAGNRPLVFSGIPNAGNVYELIMKQKDLLVAAR